MKAVDVHKGEEATSILRYLTILSDTRIAELSAVEKIVSILESYGSFAKRKMNISKADESFD